MSGLVGLPGAVVVIVGGGGIGDAAARRCAAEGAKVVIGDLSGDAAEATASAIRAGGGEAIGQKCDVADEGEVAALFATAIDRHGEIAGLFANAADVQSDSFLGDYDIVGAPLSSFDRAIQVNLRGLLLCTRAAVPLMLKRGGGSIVYTSSEAALIGAGYSHFYGCAKAGLNALMRHVVFDYGRRGIRANAISPGMIMTPNTRAKATPEQVKGQLDTLHVPALGEPDEIGSLAAYLLSDECRFLQGQVLSVSGGLTMR